MLTVTEPARIVLLEKMRGAGLDTGYAARLRVLGRLLSGFKYDFRTVPMAERSDDDTVIDLGEFQMYVDAMSMSALNGAVIDVKPEGGLRIDNPNPHITSQIESEIAEVLETKINPGVSVHGGAVLLVDVQDNTVYLNMEGGCKGCGMARTTFKMGIETMLKEAIPSIEEIIDITEHDKGEHPFYAKEVEGPSPLQQ